MPIRINFLAEQLEAEEARRRDPVKRAFWVGGALVGVMLLWIASLQVRVVSAKGELSRYEAKLASVEENSKEARMSWAATGELENRLANLQRYSTNRFFCAAFLDALQQVVLDDVRVIQLQSAHSYATNPPSSFKTNLVFPVPTRPRWYSFWRSAVAQTNVQTLLSNQIALITNKVEALKTTVPLISKVDWTTNRQQVTAQVEITKPLTAVEQVVLTIKARDYGNPSGRRVDEFSKAIATQPYFAQRLLQEDGQGIRLRERAIQPELDAVDPTNPGKPYIPFVIECRYRDTLRANE
jgi:hypothetical protein